MSNLNLLPHNVAACEAVKAANASGERLTCILNATGTGKTYISLSLAEDFPNKTFLIITPLTTIKEYYEDLFKQYNIKNIQVITYQYLVSKKREELKNMRFDYLILDEFHHIGAPIWGDRIEYLISSHRFANVLGISAYSVRDRGTPFERDMAEPNGDEIFSDKIVYEYDLASAISDGLIPYPKYRGIHYKLPLEIENLSRRISSKDPNHQKYMQELFNAKKQINGNESAKKLILGNITPTSKCIYFCPVRQNNSINDIDTIMNETHDYLISNGYKEEDIIFYKSTYNDPNSVEDRKLFYNDLDHNNESCNNKLRIMFTINQYNEGLHVPNVDTVILGRETSSDIVFFEQIGRALAINDKGISPTIIDLTDNYLYMSELVEKLTHQPRPARNTKTSIDTNQELNNYSLDVEYMYHDIYNLLEEIKSNVIKLTWDEAFELASAYYQTYGNLKIPSNYKTLDGIESDNIIGYELGTWIIRNRVDYKNKTLSQDRIDKLNSIGMIWQVKKAWQESYEIAKDFYHKNGHLIVPANYVTEDGYPLGNWIALERTRYHKGILSADKIKLLEDISMEWTRVQSWEESYQLLENFYNHYGNTDVPWNFKTKDGINSDITGYNLYSWLRNQKTMEATNSLAPSRKEKLNLLQVEWLKPSLKKKLTSDQYLVLLSNFYETYGHLDIKRGFWTKDGIHKLNKEEGYDLGAHISRLRTKYKNKQLSPEEIDIYNSIGMIWQVQKNKKLSWEDYYKFCEIFYIKNNHLNVPATFKTKNGYDYDEEGYPFGNWIYLQRKSKDTLEPERITLLDKLHMIWSPKKDIEKIKTLAKKHGIDFENYQNILLTIPYDDFVIRLNYLLSTDSLLVINDHLNPIFAASRESLDYIYDNIKGSDNNVSKKISK